ncbi:MAG TPA: hypothetical protein DD440_00420, partial [Porticoccaceae bacterium]|nr:hypothetical protein [Porticoccaceae bacterium]
LSFEFFTAADENSVYAESFALRGDGVNDIAFYVADLEAEMAKLASKGVLPLRAREDGRSVYFETRAEGNIMVRLVQR